MRDFVSGRLARRAPSLAPLTWLGVAALRLMLTPLAAGQSPTSTRLIPYDTTPPGAGDLIRLKIWREPDLSGDFSVDETGTVVFPKIGALQVTEESVVSLKKKLVSAYEVYLNQTSIDVAVLRRVQVLGAVRNPGLYPLDPTMTIADALALAGGTTPQGSVDKLNLVRGGKRLPARLSRRTLIGDSPVRSGDQIYVPERSWIGRNPWIFGALVTGTLSVALAIVNSHH